MSKTEKQGHRHRLRERFASGDDTSRSEEVLLELLLTYAIPQKDVQPLTKRLLSEFGDLSAVLKAPMDRLSKIDGLKLNSAVLLKLVDWIRQHHGSKRISKETRKTASQRPLFEGLSDEKKQTPPVKRNQQRKKVAPRRGTELFSMAILKEAIQILPKMPNTESLDEIRSFLRANLHFSAEQTRQRNSNYIIRRMFPEGYADKPLRMFAKAFPTTQDLRDVCFYRFLKAEPLEEKILNDLIIPNLGSGHLNRELIRKYLSERYPLAKSIGHCSKAIVDVLSAAGIAKVDRTKISFGYRDIPIFSFAFVLHSEFFEPGMYDIRKIQENRIFRTMLWNPERLLASLYELRNRGLISNVSEIDNVRQFTTRHTLAKVVEQIVSGDEKK